MWQILVEERMVTLGSFFKRARAYLRIADLRERFHEIEASMKRLSDGAAEVRLSLSDTRYVRAAVIYSTLSNNITRILDEAEALDRLTRELHDKVSEVVSGFDSNLRTLGLSRTVYSSLPRSRR
jgi:hypothetical protein